jgi:CheY-like chemotaxis protein
MRDWVLVVEDDEDVRETLGMVLETEGYEVVGAANGREALDRLGDGSLPCLILTDIMMPVSSGWELIESISRNPRLSQIPVVVLSAAETRELPAPNRVVAFLPKPTDLNTLIDLVKKHSLPSGPKPG